MGGWLEVGWLEVGCLVRGGGGVSRDGVGWLEVG